MVIVELRAAYCSFWQIIFHNLNILINICIFQTQKQKCRNLRQSPDYHTVSRKAMGPTEAMWSQKRHHCARFQQLQGMLGSEEGIQDTELRNIASMCPVQSSHKRSDHPQQLSEARNAELNAQKGRIKRNCKKGGKSVILRLHSLSHSW